VGEGAAGAASGAAAAPRGSAPHGASRWDGVALPYPVEASTLALIEAQDWDAVLPARALGWRWRAGQRVKRGVDLVVAALLLVVLAPLFAVAALAIRVSGPGPIFYPWRVLGHRGRPFVGYKFRTMVANADELKPALLHQNEMAGPVFKIRDDPRVTPVGRWLRKFSIDELPQLWSVVRGDMSLVGPRPCLAEEFVGFEPWQRGKLAVVPGITCLWQVEGRSHITDFEEWARLDLRYIRDWSLGLDLRILLRTVPTVLRGEGAY
jgi:lipopolysaccharide/colanic/teichoic acid biosynthesis glycosyltransferase